VTTTESIHWLYEVDWASTAQKSEVLKHLAGRLDPEFEASLLNRPGSLRGTEGLRAFGEAVENDFVELEYEPRRVADASDDQVVVAGELHGRARTTGLEVTAEFAHLWTLRDGRVRRISALSDPDEALGQLEEG
jgi:ketosteroid isomerase-like protein